MTETTQPPGARTVLVRYGDLFTKSREVRERMERRLRENLAAALDAADVDADVERRRGRLLVRVGEDDVETATAAAARTFGVVSASPAVGVEPTLSAVCEALTRTAHTVHDGGAFAVDARRSAKALPFTSEDVEREGGSAVWAGVEAAGGDPEVDLDDPDRTYYVECRAERAFVFVEKRAGPGGLPLGSQRPVAALVSGGIDSPVAAYELMRRGCPVVAVYVDLGSYGGPDHRARAVETVRTLAEYAPNRETRLYCVPGGETVDLLVEELESGRMLALRRFLLKVAETVAGREGASGIVTGEAMGQKSSQTAANLAATDPAVDVPVHRPLLTADKSEIAERARTVGTFDDATIPVGCERISPETPATAADTERLAEREPDDLFERAERAAREAEVLTVAGKREA